MAYATLIMVLILVLLIILAIALILLVKYMDKRDKGNFHLLIKLGPFMFDVDTSAEKIIKRTKKD